MSSTSDRRPAPTQIQDQVADRADADGIEPARRLVEEEQLRLPEQRLPEPDALEHAFRKCPHRPIHHGPQPDDVAVHGRTPPALGGRQAEQIGVVPVEFARRRPGGELELFGQVAEAGSRRAVACRPAEDLCASSGRRDGPDEQQHGGGLAGAVRPEEAEDLTAGDLEVEPVESAPPVVCLCETGGLDNEVGGGPHPAESIRASMLESLR